MTDTPPAVALLFDDTELGGHLRDALHERGARIVHEGDVSGQVANCCNRWAPMWLWSTWTKARTMRSTGCTRCSTVIGRGSCSTMPRPAEPWSDGIAHAGHV